jgi:hypothetical protein
MLKLNASPQYPGGGTPAFLQTAHESHESGSSVNHPEPFEAVLAITSVGKSGHSGGRQPVPVIF